MLRAEGQGDSLEKPVSFYTSNALKEVYERIAKHRDWPRRWAGITPVNQG